MLHGPWRAILIIPGLLTCSLTLAAEDSPSLQHRFDELVLPFVKQYCIDCHGAQKQEGKLDLSADTTLKAIVQNHRTWEIVRERLTVEEMPPAGASRHPSMESRKAVINWINDLREDEARRHAGDPGIVLARRLSNAEYDNTIRDLTGFDIRPTREFPVDPANEAGFDNSGESLTMSPALLGKYLAAARHVAGHIVLKPKGFVFAPHSAIAETDRDKYCVQRIVDFYGRHRVDLADYFLAAWKYEHREQLGKSAAALTNFATTEVGSTDRKLGTRYLEFVWSTLMEPVDVGPLVEVQSEWKTLLTGVHDPDDARKGCEQLRDHVLKLRRSLDTKIEKLHVKGQSDGSQPLILWWNRQLALQRTRYFGDGKDQALDQARDRFCRLFPNDFAVTSRGLYADQKLGADVRLLTAGFHLMQGYFRDDGPLYDLILEEREKAELDALWQELTFVTQVPLRQYKDFLFFERAEPPRFAGGPEFDFARPEDKDGTSETKLLLMRERYLARAREIGAGEQAIEAIESYFASISRDARWIESAHRDAEPSHLDSLTLFAERAYRRPLTDDERKDLLAFYRTLREADGLTHEDAIRDCVTSVLMSPRFCFRYELVTGDQPIQPLTDSELASRLSYFLWASMPDRELLDRAAAGQLRQPDVLISQTRRMLLDGRVRGLVTEFAGNWLEFRRFQEHNGVDRDRFPGFTNDLRAAMYEEPIRFITDVIQRNGTVDEFLNADHTFVNSVLAKHYGIPLPESNAAGRSTQNWVRIDRARDFGRGGLLPMSVFLTRNSPGLRTSPVKRGYWVVRRFLGEHIPAPPPNVPELPTDEARLGDSTLAQVLALHRDHQACAGCHQRFDSIGLVFEGYGPIGERRDRDLGDRLVETTAVFPDGSHGSGLDGLRKYLSQKRQDEFVDNLSRKLLAYALGRTLQLSDEAAIRQMRTRMTETGNKFQSLIETIVVSPQFLNKRGRDASME